MRYVRFEAESLSEPGRRVGVFSACHQLRLAGRLSREDDSTFAGVDVWFTEHLPGPPIYADGGAPEAVTWFKLPATQFVEALAPLTELLTRNGIAWNRIETDDPGTIVYEDEYQVAAIPRGPAL